MAFDSLSEAFDTDYTPEDRGPLPSTIPNKMISVVSSAVPEDKITLDNKAFVRSEIQQLVGDCKDIIFTYKEDLIREGAKASQVEAFSTLITSTANLLHELNEMDRVENDLKLRLDNNITKKSIASKKSDPDIPDGAFSITQTITMSGSEMLEHLLNARKNAEINAVDADFKVIDEKLFDD